MLHPYTFRVQRNEREVFYTPLDSKLRIPSASFAKQGLCIGSKRPNDKRELEDYCPVKSFTEWPTVESRGFMTADFSIGRRIKTLEGLSARALRAPTFSHKILQLSKEEVDQFTERAYVDFENRIAGLGLQTERDKMFFRFYFVSPDHRPD